MLSYEAGVAVGVEEESQQPVLDACLSVFFPLYSFAGWTVYHPTSERGAYKSSSKPRARFLSGPVSVSICLYLFFCIFPPLGPWFVPSPPPSSLPLIHFIGCLPHPLQSPPQFERWTPRALPVEHHHAPHPHPQKAVCMLLAAPRHQKHVQRRPRHRPLRPTRARAFCISSVTSFI